MLRPDILVVDDTPANLVAIEAALDGLGHLVTARSGAEALARLLEQDFALILLDVQMPGMDGFETAKLIRSRERTRRTPIIFVTAYERDERDTLHGYQLGAVDFLFKPIHPDVLRAKAHVFVELHERSAQVAYQAEQLRQAQLRDHERALADQRAKLEADALQRQIERERRAAEELAQLNAQLAAADRKKDEFLAILAHELRNPLAPIQAALELIGQQPGAPAPPHIREILERQTQHLTRLVDDLLDISRITSGKIELRREPLLLHEVAAQAVVTSRPLIEERRHELVICGDQELAVVGDAVRLTQVIANLLNNAAKYTDPGGRIALAYGQDDGEAFVRVSDTGRGIPEGLLGRIFELFVQERAGSDGAGGLGLGLSLVRSLVELHGGRVAVSSPGKGKGSTFEIRLPVASAAVAPRVASSYSPGAAAQPGKRKLRAVVVDDHPDLRDMIAALLASWGHQVETAEDGPSGLALIRERRPDVALLDIGLPGMDGYAVARALRGDAGETPLRLIAMTGYGQDKDRERALEAGFDVHIVKPATAEVLMRALGEPEAR